MANQWYALRCKPNREEVVWHLVQAREITCYYPHLRVRTVNPRARKVRPYFPGYMFVFADLSEVGVSEFNWMPSTVGLVNFGGDPAPVPEGIILGVQKTIDRLTASGKQWYDELVPGEKVAIQKGPFEGYEAIFDTRISGRDRVRVLLQLLSGQSVAIDMDAADLKPTKPYRL